MIELMRWSEWMHLYALWKSLSTSSLIFLNFSINVIALVEVKAGGDHSVYSNKQFGLEGPLLAILNILQQSTERR